MTSICVTMTIISLFICITIIEYRKIKNDEIQDKIAERIQFITDSDMSSKDKYLCLVAMFESSVKE